MPDESFLQEASLNMKQPQKHEHDEGDLIDIETFVACCKHNYFINYDGFGYWSTDSELDTSEQVVPSNVVRGDQKAPDWATHVMWYNR